MLPIDRESCLQLDTENVNTWIEEYLDSPYPQFVKEMCTECDKSEGIDLCDFDIVYQEWCETKGLDPYPSVTKLEQNWNSPYPPPWIREVPKETCYLLDILSIGNEEDPDYILGFNGMKLNFDHRSNTLASYLWNIAR
jgi:hypothetical protein